MEYSKAKVTIDLEEYNQLLQYEKNIEFSHYKKALSIVTNNLGRMGSARIIQDAVEEVKKIGLKMIIKVSDDPIHYGKSVDVSIETIES